MKYRILAFHLFDVTILLEPQLLHFEISVIKFIKMLISNIAYPEDISGISYEVSLVIPVSDCIRISFADDVRP